MTVMDIVWIVVVGGLIGWVASILMKTNSQMGLLANVVVGIVGAWVGTWLGPKLGIVISGDLSRILLSLGGAVLVIFALRLLRVLR